MTPFKAIVRAEGSKGNNLRITVPTAIVAQLRAAGFIPPGWVRLSIDDFEPVFVIARYPLSRPSTTCTLPAWAFPDLQPGVEITARVEDTMPYCATIASLITSPFDWLAFVDSTYLPTAEGDTLVLWSRHEEPFKLNRHGGEGLSWLVAHAQNSATAADWTFASANPATLERAAQALQSIGIGRERQYVETRNGVKVLHVAKSRPLLRLFAALAN